MIVKACFYSFHTKQMFTKVIILEVIRTIVGP